MESTEETDTHSLCLSQKTAPTPSLLGAWGEPGGAARVGGESKHDTQLQLNFMGGLLFFCSVGVEPRAVCLLGACSTTEPRLLNSDKRQQFSLLMSQALDRGYIFLVMCFHYEAGTDLGTIFSGSPPMSIDWTPAWCQGGRPRSSCHKQLPTGVLQLAHGMYFALRFQWWWVLFFK